MSISIVTSTYHEFDIFEILPSVNVNAARGLRRDIHCAVASQTIAFGVSTIFVRIQIGDDIVFIRGGARERNAPPAAVSALAIGTTKVGVRIHFNPCALHLPELGDTMPVNVLVASFSVFLRL